MSILSVNHNVCNNDIWESEYWDYKKEIWLIEAKTAVPIFFLKLYLVFYVIVFLRWNGTYRS